MAGTKERILDSSAELFRRQGFTGTGVKQIAAAASAPFGSLYHFFPGGKDQLGEEVIRWSGAMYLQLFVTIAREAEGDPVGAVEAFFSGAAATLEETGYEDACPIATVALEVASTNEPLRKATADVFETWIAGAVTLLTSAGIAEGRARELALEMLCALEGAFLFSRAMRTTAPMHVAGAAVAASVREALSASR
jgi:AcrR family transcriptional regulator